MDEEGGGALPRRVEVDDLLCFSGAGGGFTGEKEGRGLWACWVKGTVDKGRLIGWSFKGGTLRLLFGVVQVIRGLGSSFEA